MLFDGVYALLVEDHGDGVGEVLPSHQLVLSLIYKAGVGRTLEIVNIMLTFSFSHKPYDCIL